MSQEHQLRQTSDGWYCERCEITWKQSPSGTCPGVKIYSYTSIPWDTLTTYTQLKRQKLKPATSAVGCYFRLKDKEYIYLYRIDEAVSRRIPTEKQKQAISKMQEALKKRYTCQRCGWYDMTRGQSRSKYYQGDIYTLKVDGEDRLYCEDCRRYMIWSYDRHVIEHNMRVSLESETAPPVLILDTETTGLPDDSGFQVVEIAAIDRTGSVIFHSLVKPDAPIMPGAVRKHGLTESDLANAPTFTEIWPSLVEILSHYEMWCYNSDFDRDAIISSAERFKLEVPKRVRNLKHWNCMMEEFATYYGMWSDYFGSYKWQDLAFACGYLDVPDNGFHRALSDVMNTLGIMRALAARGGTFPVPESQPIYVSSGYYYERDDDY